MATEVRPQGRKDVREAVLIAALCSLATGFISWGFDAAKRKFDEAKSKKSKGRKQRK